MCKIKDNNGSVDATDDGKGSRLIRFLHLRTGAFRSIYFFPLNRFFAFLQRTDFGVNYPVLTWEK